jgi:cell division protein FtsN
MKKTSLRFDAKETVVLFSLFIFVSLLMFTVGILVGKGMTQARYESRPVETAAEKPADHHAGSSVSMGAHHDAPHEEAAVPETKAEVPVAAVPEKAEEPALKLIPLKPTQAEANGVHLSDSRTEAAALLKNPKILALIEPETKGDTKRALGSEGTYTVQVGSYPNETAAQERVDALRKLGFPQAFFSAKELGSASGTWYRVWLGQYPDYLSAKKTGDQLQARGEVKNYIVRKIN